MGLAANKVFMVNGGRRFPVEWNAQTTVEQQRGHLPHQFSLIVSDEGMKDISNSNPWTAEITVPNGSGQTRVLKWKGWYLTSFSPYPNQEGTFKADFADVRWRMAYNKLTAAYNQTWADGLRRASSLKDAGQNWKTYEAVEDALNKFGFDVGKNLLGPALKKIELPENLGNSPAGGWVSASLAESIPVMLESIRADMVMGFDGKIYLTGRSIEAGGGKTSSGGASAALRALAPIETQDQIAGLIATQEVKWQKPEKILVRFEKIVEGIFLYEESKYENKTAATVDLGLHGWVVENVTPKYNPSLAIQSSEWDRIDRVVPFAIGILDPIKHVREHYFRPEIFPLQRHPRTREILDTPNDAIVKDRVGDLVRSTFRKTFRVRTEPDTANPFSEPRKIAGIRLGRLDEEGGVVAAGGVYMDYSSWLMLGKPKPGFKGVAGPVDMVFSENYPLARPLPVGSVRAPLTPAPFTTRWVDPIEMIYEIVADRPERDTVRRNVFGQLSEPLNYGSLFEHKKKGGSLMRTPLKGELASGWRSIVFWSGRQVAPLNSGRHRRIEHTETIAAFDDGLVDEVVVKARELTANYVFDDGDLLELVEANWVGADDAVPMNLLNKRAIKERAKKIADQIIQSYERNVFGVAVCAGVEPLVQGLTTRDDIQLISIRLGDPDPWSITTHIVVQPEVRMDFLNQEALAGQPALLAQEP